MSLRPLSPFGALGWTLGATVLTALVMSAAALLVPSALGTLTVPALIETLVYAAVIALALRDSGGTPRDVLGLARASWPVLGLSILLGVALHGPSDALYALVDRVWPVPEEELVARFARMRPERWLERALLLAAVAGAVPIVEELFYRGVLYARLRAAGAVSVAGLVTTGLFTLSHLDPRSWPALLPVAIALGVLRSASGGAVPGVLLHAAFNATTLLVVYSSTPSELARAGASPFVALAGAGVSALLLSALVRLGRGEFEVRA